MQGKRLYIGTSSTSPCLMSCVSVFLGNGAFTGSLQRVTFLSQQQLGLFRDFHGTLSFVDMNDVVIQTEDISAGGLKFISNVPLEEHLEYNINIDLSNNLTIKCTIQPIRIQQIDYKGEKAYSISGKFKNIESIDRIALVQYSFRSLTEAENIGNH